MSLNINESISLDFDAGLIQDGKVLLDQMQNVPGVCKSVDCYNCVENRCTDVHCTEVRCHDVHCNQVHCHEVRCTQTQCPNCQCTETRCSYCYSDDCRDDSN